MISPPSGPSRKSSMLLASKPRTLSHVFEEDREIDCSSSTAEGDGLLDLRCESEGHEILCHSWLIQNLLLLIVIEAQLESFQS